VWGIPAQLNNTVVLAESADVRDWTKVVVVNLPENSDIRAAVNLVTNEGNLGKVLKVTGALKKQLGAAGLVVATGTSGEFELEGNETIEDGTQANPYSVANVVRNQGASANNNFLWATGYVVGIWESKDANGNDLYPNNFAKFEAPFYTDVNILIADSPTETNITNIVCVQLSAGQMRTDLSPMNNAAILGEKVTLYGSFEKYNGLSGIKNVQDYTPKNGGGGTDPEPGGDGDGSQGNPYNIINVKANQGAKNNTDFKWAAGYVVGIWEGKDENGADIYPNNFAKFEAPFYTDVNLLIADSPNETNKDNTVCVQLSAGDMRTDLSPMLNAAILKTKITLYGAFEKYNGLDGIKNVQDYTPKGTGGTDPEPGGDGDGSASDKPYSVAQAIANQGTTGDSATWTKGYIVGSVKNGKTTIASADDVWLGVTSGWDLNTNVLIADSPNETDYTKCVVVNLPAGKDLRTLVNLVDNPDNYQKSLTVKGTLRKYFGIAGLRDSAGTSSDFILN